MLQTENLFRYGLEDLLINALIYSAVVVPFFLFFWVLFKNKLKHRRIQKIQRSTKQILKHEIRYSISTLLVFATIDVALYAAQSNGYTQIYNNISDYGWTYFAFSIIAMIVLHDAWFYWTHRLMHHPKLFKIVHKVHHQSIDPSPFAAFSFHPLEAIVEAGAYVIFSFLFPVHLVALFGWQLLQMVLNVIGHLGYEIYPKGFNTHWLFKFKTPSTHHNLHHSKFGGNYGLYFTWWDRWCKTEFKEYDTVYEKLQDRIKTGSKVVSAFALLFVFSHYASAQSFEITPHIGFGKPYIIESIEEKNDLCIGYAPTFMLGLKYIPKNSEYWGIILATQYFETRVKGITRISQTPVNGFISNTSIFCIAEKSKSLKQFSKWNFISAYGIGISFENYLFDAEQQSRTSIYTSLYACAGFRYRINENLNLQFTDGLLITDFVKGIHYVMNNWLGQSAGEDISKSLLFGLNYKF